MIPSPPALAYRRAAAQQASTVGLVIALYDTLAGDLGRAVAALHGQAIEERSRCLKHGFVVLAQLESLINLESGGETAQHLRRFYNYLRNEMLRAQFTQDAEILKRAIPLILDVRSAWEQVDTRTAEDGKSGDHGTHLTESDQRRLPLNCQA